MHQTVRIPLWIVIAASALGVTLMALIFTYCYKVGFFDRVDMYSAGNSSLISTLKNKIFLQTLTLFQSIRQSFTNQRLVKLSISSSILSCNRHALQNSLYSINYSFFCKIKLLILRAKSCIQKYQTETVYPL